MTSITLARFAWLTALALLAAASGCAAGATASKTKGSGGASGGSGGSASIGGTGGSGGGGLPCTPGSSEACYDGPAEHGGVGVCAFGTRTCPSSGLTVWGPCEGWVAAGTESCDGTLDDDCDGSVDEGCTCREGTTMPCGSDVGVCEAGTQTCSMGAWGACVGGVTPTAEVCDNAQDDDCDAASDCADSDCAGHPACSANCGNGICDPGETPTACPCDCSGCTSNANCGGLTPECCIKCGCSGPALQCVSIQDCCG
jgi:hypothetical protein